MKLDLSKIQKAHKIIHDHIVRTPFEFSHTLSKITGAKIYLKFENAQFTASFKERGAVVKLLSLTPKQRKKGVIAMSAGNHAQAVAYHSKKMGIEAVIVMPSFTPNVKVERTKKFGAKVILHGNGLDESATFAKSYAKKTGLQLIHPYDDEQIIAGQGTVAIEMLEQVPNLDTIVVPIGGGGLISGISVAAKKINPLVEIVGVQTARFPAMLYALKNAPAKISKSRRSHSGVSSIAEGIAVKDPGRLTLPIVRKFIKHIYLVDENDIEHAVLLLLDIEKSVVEGAGAASLAAILKNPKSFAGQKVGLVLTGGNIDLLVLSSIIQRGLVRSGRLVRLHVATDDSPGSLAAVTGIIAGAAGNIVDVYHHRAFTNLPLQSADVEFVLQTRGLSHLREILRVLNQSGYKAKLIDKTSN